MTPISVYINAPSDFTAQLTDIQVSEEITDGDIDQADFGTDDRNFTVRASRNGDDPRSYLAFYQITNPAGQTVTRTVKIVVN